MSDLRIIVIPADSDAPMRVESIVGSDSLAAMQALVGGFIEMPVWRAGRLSGTDSISGWPVINEEGKFDQEAHPRNERATALLKPDLFPGDWVAGDCILVGGNEITGDTVSLPERFSLDLIERTIAFQTERTA